MGYSQSVQNSPVHTNGTYVTGNTDGWVKNPATCGSWVGVHQHHLAPQYKVRMRCVDVCFPLEEALESQVFESKRYATFISLITLIIAAMAYQLL
jgi:hypothetical protein